jgi:DNA-binding transcriptional LysR family regulator
MNLKQLEIFLALTRTPNVSRVADECCLTQSAVSVALKGLEEELNVRLFDRVNRRLVLSAYGRLFADQLEPTMSRLHETLRIFEGDTLSGRLLIGASYTFGDYILPEVLFDFREEYPEAQIEVRYINTRDVIEELERCDIDMGFIEGDCDSEQLNCVRLCDDELFVVTRDREFAAQGPYTMEDLLQNKWIMREPGSGTRTTFEHHLGELTRKLNIFLELNHSTSIARVLNRPGTLACMSPFTILKELEEEDLFPVPVQDHHFLRTFCCVTHSKRHETRLMKRFRHAVDCYLHTDFRAASQEAPTMRP